MRIKTKKKKRKSFELILGFRRIERPEFIETLVFPADSLTRLDSEQVSDLHAKYTLLYAYANQGLAETAVNVLRLQNRRNERENMIYRKNPGINTLDKWRRDAKLKEDTEVEIINTNLTIEHVRRIYLEAMLVNYEKFIAALSRELSRKSFERPANF